MIAYYSKEDGWFRNLGVPVAGRTPGASSKGNNAEDFFIRGTLTFKSSDDTFRMKIKVNHGQRDRDGYGPGGVGQPVFCPSGVSQVAPITTDCKLNQNYTEVALPAAVGALPRVSTYELIRENYETVNFTASTETLVKAASRLVDELPEGVRPAECIAHWRQQAKADDAARGVMWPEVPPEIQFESGLAWAIWPNQNILHGVTFAGPCYRVRPYGDDPNQCIFESYALERYPDGKAPETTWVYAEPNAENWGPVLEQDFANMEFVHKGMKSSGFGGALPNPHQEQKVINLHRNLAEWMEGRGAPKKLDG